MAPYVSSRPKYRRRKRARRGKRAKQRSYASSTYRPRALGFATMGKSLGFPRENIVKMRYCDWLTMSSTTGIMQKYYFSATSIYDPDLSGTGHAPMMKSFWQTIYNHYEVQSATIKCQFSSRIGATPAVVVGIFTADAAHSINDWNTLAEQGRGQYKSIAGYNVDANTVGASYNRTKFFSKSMGHKDTKALMTADPADNCLFNLYLQSQDKSSTSSLFDVKVTIDYVVRVFEPKTQSTS